MTTSMKRMIGVAIAHFLVLEGYLQLSVQWSESRGERWGMCLYLLTALALVWALWPAFVKTASWGLRATLRGATVLGVFAALLAADNLYFWHVRPNVGLYEEAGWVGQHPGFQKELRAKIAANTWWTRGG